MKTEARTEDLHLQAKECLEPPKLEEVKKIAPWSLPISISNLWPLELGEN